MNTETMHDQDTEVETEVGTMNGEGGGLALEAVDRAAIDIQVATAKRYPRSVDKSLKEALTLATLDEETAASCFYVLPRGGKKIEGPSARLAEIMAYSWGNLRADADIVDEDRTHVTAMGTCFDLEKNVAVRVRVKRRITDKRGKRYNEDMIGVTSNAAVSIALRNAVFKVIPAAFTRRIYQEARTASIGKGGTITQKRQNALVWFAQTGISEEVVYELLDVEGLDDIGEDELIVLRGLKTAITEGETNVEDILRRHDNSTEDTESLNEAIRKKAEAKKGEAATEDDEDEDDPEAEPTDSQVETLKGLMAKAAEAGVLDFDDAEGLELAIHDQDGPAVRKGIADLQRALLQAGAERDGELPLDGEGT